MHTRDLDIDDLEVASTAAASYIDACDHGLRVCDANRYRLCAHALDKIFTLVDAKKYFPELLKQSAAARDAYDNVRLASKINTSVVGYFPDLAIALRRMSR